MAIKGKGRTRPRQPVRAPRRAAVPVPVPFFRRRWVQALAAFIAGLLVFWGGVWLTNGLRAGEAQDRGREEELLRRRAGEAWEDLVAREIGAIGQVPPGRPPVVLPQVPRTIRTLRDRTPAEAVGTLRTAAADARAAIDAIEGYQLPVSLRDKGFERADVLRFLSAHDELITAIDLYRRAALLAALAAGLEGPDRHDALGQANQLVSTADTALARFQTHQSEALTAAGIVRQPTLPGA
jgi:hypothetical protein